MKANRTIERRRKFKMEPFMLVERECESRQLFQQIHDLRSLEVLIFHRGVLFVINSSVLVNSRRLQTVRKQ